MAEPPLLVNIDELPPFASERNKRLHQKVQSQSKLLQQLQEQLKENEERVSVLSDHLKNVQQVCL